MRGFLRNRMRLLGLWTAVLGLGLAATMLVAACGGEAEPETVIQTVVVAGPERTVVEKVVETVVVEKVVEGETVMEVQTVIVERPVTVTEKVVETVLVEREVEGKTVTVVETVVVEKQVTVTEKVVETVVVEKAVTVTEKVVETVIVVATPVPATPIPLPTAIAINIPDPKNPPGTLVMAIDAVGTGGGLHSAGSSAEGAMHMGITETFFQVTDESAEGPMLASAWSLAPDLSSVTIELQQGVEFHGGWGEMTAEDVAYNVNDANAGTTPLSIHGQAGDMNALFGSNPWEVIDTYTVKATFAAFNPTWASRELNLGGESVAILSKAAIDTNGEDWAKEPGHMMGTGPFEIVEWVPDDRIVTAALPSHWRKAAGVSNITWLEISEPDTKIALLRTGEVDMGEIPLARVGELKAQGFEVLAAGGRADEIGIMFGGNLWETHHAVSGEPLERGPLAAARALPWLGHPDDEADMEQARIVRHALALAIDRELMNEQLNNGLGWPTYITMFSPTAPEWQEKWNIPYDPAEAERLLDEAGLPRKDNGVRFEIVLYGQPSPPTYAHQAQAIAGMWDEIGVLTTAQTHAYSIIRPSFVQRTATTPFLKTCGESTSSAPWDWPRGIKMSSFSRGGFSCAQEAPEVAGFLKAAQLEPDREKRIEINNQLAEWMYHWAFAPGVLAVPRVVTINPKSIESWDMPRAFQASFRAPENIVSAR